MAPVDARTPWEADLARRLAAAREKAQASTEEVSKIARQYGVLLYGDDIVKIEAGERPIQLGEALVLCKVMDLPLPVVTGRVQDQLINASYLHKHLALSRQLDKLLFGLMDQKKKVDDFAEKLAAVIQAFEREMANVDGTRDPDVDTSLHALLDTADAVAKSFHDLDRRLDGALSTPAGRAREPGSQ